MSARGIRSRLPGAVATALVLSLALAGCTDVDGQSASRPEITRDAGQQQQPPDDSAGAPAPAKSVAKISTNVDAGAKAVAVDTSVEVAVSDGRLGSVEFRSSGGEKLSGSFNRPKTSWTADEPLEPGTSYVVDSAAQDDDGLVKRSRTPFRTDALTLDEQTYANITPLDGETVGVGMPVIVQFDVPVADHAAFERRMHVRSSPAVRGSWRWMSDSEAHWRPAGYWAPGTTVDVHLDLNSLYAGNGIYGQLDRSMSFDIGRSVVMRANLRTDRMRVFVGGSLARSIPVTGGKRGFETRSGTKLIVEKFESKRMDAATVGIEKDDPEYYNIPKVEYAQRVTFTGEFLHAAPWSVSDQGARNVSHGCVGMSTSNAAWLFDRTHRGDPMEVTGTDRGLEAGNGWTDWNISFAEYQQGSAL